ncbi:protein RALF-like 25 [Humulus lupulus]|uniref:protein RALF-like 25 n=1 Tax=Humulus lupulus TaxID=3486 RepID=UPI002B40A6CB|nr:protein RALF-like 25 [Humulus lupulus]
MKSWVAVVAVVLSIMLVVSEAASGPSSSTSDDKKKKTNNKMINPGVLDPCQRPGGPHKGCQNPYEQRTPANKYNRGCTNPNRCRH